MGVGRLTRSMAHSINWAIPCLSCAMSRVPCPVSCVLHVSVVSVGILVAVVRCTKLLQTMRFQVTRLIKLFPAAWSLVILRWQNGGCRDKSFVRSFVHFPLVRYYTLTTTTILFVLFFLFLQLCSIGDILSDLFF